MKKKRWYGVVSHPAQTVYKVIETTNTVDLQKIKEALIKAKNARINRR